MRAEGLIQQTSPHVTAVEPGAAPRPPATAEAGRAPNRAKLTLELAGRAIDPTAPDASAPEIARLLFHEAIIDAAQLASENGSPRLDLDHALVVLEQGRHLSAAGVSADTLRSALSEGTPPPTGPALRALELPISKVVESAIGTSSLARAERLRRWAARALGGLAALAILAYGVFYLAAASFPYRVSSAHAGFPTESYIGRIHAYGLVLHTQQQPGPWVEIDLEQERTISTIVLKNRADCCTDRGLPLIVELGDPDKNWKQLARKTEKYDQWVLHFPPQSARYVRLRSTANTVLQFREIQVK